MALGVSELLFDAAVLMCGIAGEINFGAAPDHGSVKAMTDAIWRRGPDAEGFGGDGAMYFGHRRLSVLDPQARADQPMIDASGRFVIVYNGEIYNFQAIKKELESLGEHFVTTGDTEVLLAAYRVWGEDCLQKLNGMFALAIWDKQQQSFFAARDRFGEKPFYYSYLPDGRFIFASELQALRAHPAVGKDLDPGSVSRYLACGYTLGERTILKSVKRLPPACFLRFSKGKSPEISTYWDIASLMRNPSPAQSYEEAQEALLELLDDSVRIRMISDVPLGAFLSGGVDSAAIVSSMVRERDSKSIKTFTIGFSEKTYSEAEQAANVASYLHVDHHAKTIKPNLCDDILQILTDSDEPFADNSIIPTFYLAKFAREQVTVALSGDGGDELFGGYETYLATKLHRVLRVAPGGATKAAELAFDRLAPVSWNKVGLDYKARRFLSASNLDRIAAHWSWRNIFDDKMRADALNDINPIDDGMDEVRRHYKRAEGLSPLQQLAYVDIKTWLCDDILVKVDRATMAHSLEARAPFLDHRLAEFALCLPDSWKLRFNKTKRVLKSAISTRVKPDVLKQKKRGFNAPIAHWISGELKPLFFDTIHSTPARAVINSAYAEELFRRHSEGRADNSYRLFALLSLGAWLNNLNTTATESQSREFSL